MRLDDLREFIYPLSFILIEEALFDASENDFSPTKSSGAAAGHWVRVEGHKQPLLLAVGIGARQLGHC